MRRTTGQSYVLPALQAAAGLVWLRAGLAQIDVGQLGMLGGLTTYGELLVGAGLIGTAALALAWRDGGDGGVPVLPSLATTA